MKRKPKPKLPIQFEDVTKAAWALQGALGNNYGAPSDEVIRWSGDPRRAAQDFVEKVQTLRRALESARKVVDTIGETRAKGAALPDMVGNVELKQRLNALVDAHGGWGAPGEPLPAAGLGSVKASIMREARKLRYEGGDAAIDRQAWRIERLESIANNWARAARLDGLDGGETEGAVSLAPVFQAGSEAWAEAAVTARRDEGESDADVTAKHARAKAEQEARAKALRETFEQAERESEADYARKRAEATRAMRDVEEEIRSGNAALKNVRDGSKRKYLINVASAKGERDALGYFKRETFAIEGRVWWPLGVAREAEDDGKGGHQASKKRQWSVSFLPVGQKVGSAFSVKEAEDMAKALAPRFREVANVGEVRSGDTEALSPLVRIVNEYNERKSEPGPQKEYRGIPYRIGQDKALPGIRWFLQRQKDHLGTVEWESSPGAWYGPKASGQAEAAVKKIIDIVAEAEAERERLEAERGEGKQAERGRGERERAEAEAERAEAERAEREQAEREREQAERTERLRKQAEREQEKQALYEQSGRDYVARTEAEHREQRERARKQREREREREHEQAERERVALAERGAWRDSQDAKRRERRDKAADKATMSRAWAAVDNAKDLASWLEALERIDRQARADGGPGASASVLIDGLPLGLDVLVFALSGKNEEAVQATFDEVASQNPQFARALRRAMVAQRGKVSAAMLASSLRRRATLAKQTGLALGPPEPVSQGVKAPKRRNMARNVAELGLRMLAMRKEPQRGPAYLPDSVPGASSEGRTGRKARKKSEDMAKKKSETEKTEKTEKPAKPKKEGRTGVSVRVGNLYRVIVGREMVDAEVIGRDEGGWILKRLPFVTAARAWEEGRQLRGRRSTEELKQCACVFDKENGT